VTRFGDYLWALLSRPYKTAAGTEIERWVGVLGSALDTQKESVFGVRRAWLVQAATGSALDLLGKERGIPRLAGETDATYRARLTAAFVEQKGTIPALLDAFNTLGFSSAEVEELFRTDPERWAEFRVLLSLAEPAFSGSQRASVLSAVGKLKPAHTALAGLDLEAGVPAGGALEDALDWGGQWTVMLHGCPLPSESQYPSETLYPC
jgi:hypothetical protein